MDLTNNLTNNFSTKCPLLLFTSIPIVHRCFFIINPAFIVSFASPAKKYFYQDCFCFSIHRSHKPSYIPIHDPLRINSRYFFLLLHGKQQKQIPTNENRRAELGYFKSKTKHVNVSSSHPQTSKTRRWRAN